jgi:hypothetical protein
MSVSVPSSAARAAEQEMNMREYPLQVIEDAREQSERGFGPFFATKAQLLEIQAKQVEHYSPGRPWLKGAVAARTRADELRDGVAYNAADLGDQIPRGVDIEFLIERREKLQADAKTALAAAGAGDVLRVVSDTGVGFVTFNVRIVRPGDGYGLDHKLKADELLVEFYDTRHEGAIPGLGQFVSRYSPETLLAHSNAGLALDGGVPSWSVDYGTLKTVQQWVSGKLGQELGDEAQEEQRGQGR